MLKYLNKYFAISKKEWNGIMVLVILIIMVLLMPYVYQLFSKDNTINLKDFNKAIAQINTKSTPNYSYSASVVDITKKASQINIKAKPGEVIELNDATITELSKIRGIGTTFANRIYRYKERLGGFFNKEQLKEIYGIDSLKFTEVKDEVSVNQYKVKRIDINSISFVQLRLFPYLSYKQANAIIEYRNQHGKYATLNDLKNIAILDNLVLQKIEPYFIFR
jgi:competence ComEA-like helix-hairpin-helix protein